MFFKYEMVFQVWNDLLSMKQVFKYVSKLEQVFKYDGKQVALCRTNPLQVEFGPWFELDWTGRPNHSMAACHGTYTYIK